MKDTETLFEKEKERVKVCDSFEEAEEGEPIDVMGAAASPKGEHKSKNIKDNKTSKTNVEIEDSEDLRSVGTVGKVCVHIGEFRIVHCTTANSPLC